MAEFFFQPPRPELGANPRTGVVAIFEVLTDRRVRVAESIRLAVKSGPAALGAEVPNRRPKRPKQLRPCVPPVQYRGERNSSANKITVIHPLTSGRKYACDDGYVTTDASVFTIDLGDGNRF